MKWLSYCRPIVYITVNRPQHEHLVDLARKENEWKRKGGGKRGGRHGRSLSGAKGTKPPIPMNELQLVREKLT